MANNSSVIKKISVTARNRARNKVYKSTIKTLTKKYIEQIDKKPDVDYVLSLQRLLSIIYSK